MQESIEGAAACSHVDRFVLFVDKTLKRTISVPCDIESQGLRELAST